MGTLSFLSAIAVEVKDHLKQWVPGILAHSKYELGEGSGFYYQIDVAGLVDDSVFDNPLDIVSNLMEAMCNFPLETWGVHDVEVYRNDGRVLTLCFNV